MSTQVSQPGSSWKQNVSQGLNNRSFIWVVLVQGSEGEEKGE